MTDHPDAALYWLAKALAGEDPEFVMRRRLILAGEDIGLADPNGIVVVTACANALQYVGSPKRSSTSAGPQTAPHPQERQPIWRRRRSRTIIGPEN